MQALTNNGCCAKDEDVCHHKHFCKISEEILTNISHEVQAHLGTDKNNIVCVLLITTPRLIEILWLTEYFYACEIYQLN